MNIENEIITLIKKTTKKNEEIFPFSKLVEDLRIDSFDKLMIVSAIEDHFAVTVDEEDFADVVTVADIIRKVEAFLSGGDKL